jgi:hypothetical protein
MLTTNTQRATKQRDIAAELALRVAQVAKLRTAITTVWPHLTKLGSGEQRLIRICEWSVKAAAPVTDEQAVWLDDIVRRVATKQVLN